MLLVAYYMSLAIIRVRETRRWTHSVVRSARQHRNDGTKSRRCVQSTPGSAYAWAVTGLGVSGVSGSNKRLPSLGTAERSMNSIAVGSLWLA